MRAFTRGGRLAAAVGLAIVACDAEETPDLPVDDGSEQADELLGPDDAWDPTSLPSAGTCTWNPTAGSNPDPSGDQPRLILSRRDYQALAASTDQHRREAMSTIIRTAEWALRLEIPEQPPESTEILMDKAFARSSARPTATCTRRATWPRFLSPATTAS
jgi:hypothetical protein